MTKAKSKLTLERPPRGGLSVSRLSMSAHGPKRTSRLAPHMSAFGGKADMVVCGCLLSRSLLGVERTSLVAPHMSAFDPKQTYFQLTQVNTCVVPDAYKFKTAGRRRLVSLIRVIVAIGAAFMLWSPNVMAQQTLAVDACMADARSLCRRSPRSMAECRLIAPWYKSAGSLLPVRSSH